MTKFLCKDLALSIELDQSNLKITLRNDLTLGETQICYEVNELDEPGRTPLDRRYHLREGLVIALRRVVSQALAEGLISDFPGTPTSSSRAAAQGVVVTLSMMDSGSE